MRWLVVVVLTCGIARADVSAPPASSSSSGRCGKGKRVRVILEPTPRPPGPEAAATPVVRATQIVVEELERAGLQPSADPFMLDGIDRVDELRRYHTREAREKNPNLGLHSNELIRRPVRLDAYLPDGEIGFIVLTSWLELAVSRGLDRKGRPFDEWQSDVRKALVAAAERTPKLRALYLLGDPGFDREDELRRLVREALACTTRAR